MNDCLFRALLGRYGVPVETLVRRFNLSIDDPEKVVKLARALHKRQEQERYAGNHRVKPLHLMVGRKLGPSTILGECSQEIKDAYLPGSPQRLFEAMCDCGHTFYLTSNKLTGMRACEKCVGFDWNKRPAGMTGGSTSRCFPKRVGALVRIETDPDDKRKCIVRCDCGKTKSVYRSAFSAGTIKSCGCGIHKSLESQS